MSQRDGYQPGVPSWIAGAHPDPEQAVAFYTGLLGWQADGRATPTSSARSTAATSPPSARRSARTPPPGARTSGSRAPTSRRAGDGRRRPRRHRAVRPPRPRPHRRARRPRRRRVRRLAAGEHRGAQIVNEPGAWAMSALTTPDPAAGAKAFYGAVFGWQADAFAMGDVEVTMWRLPGFVGGEPQQPVPRDLVATGLPGAEARLERRLLGRRRRRDRRRRRARRRGLGRPLDLPIGRRRSPTRRARRSRHPDRQSTSEVVNHSRSTASCRRRRPRRGPPRWLRARRLGTPYFDRSGRVHGTHGGSGGAGRWPPPGRRRRWAKQPEDSRPHSATASAHTPRATPGGGLGRARSDDLRPRSASGPSSADADCPTTPPPAASDSR